MFRVFSKETFNSNMGMLLVAKNLPVIGLIDGKVLVDVVNIVITAVVALGVAYINARFQKRQK